MTSLLRDLLHQPCPFDACPALHEHWHCAHCFAWVRNQEHVDTEGAFTCSPPRLAGWMPPPEITRYLDGRNGQWYITADAIDEDRRRRFGVARPSTDPWPAQPDYDGSGAIWPLLTKLTAQPADPWPAALPTQARLNAEDPLVAAGGWCGPPEPMYDVFGQMYTGGPPAPRRRKWWHKLGWQAWRDENNEGRRYGVTICAHGATIELGRTVYRCHWKDD
jgi:hypothetical protein